MDHQQKFNEYGLPDGVEPIHDDSYRRVDIERFLFSLTPNQTIIVLFKTLGYKPKEIQKFMGYKNVNAIHRIIHNMRKVQVKEEFKA